MGLICFLKKSNSQFRGHHLTQKKLLQFDKRAGCLHTAGAPAVVGRHRRGPHARRESPLVFGAHRWGGGPRIDPPDVRVPRCRVRACAERRGGGSRTDSSEGHLRGDGSGDRAVRPHPGGRARVARGCPCA